MAIASTSQYGFGIELQQNPPGQADKAGNADIWVTGSHPQDITLANATGQIMHLGNRIQVKAEHMQCTGSGTGLTVDNNATVGGTFNADGATTLNGAVTLGDAAGDTITVTGTPTFAETATFNGTLTANGAVNLGDAAGDTITVSGTPTFAEDTTFTKAIIANGNVTLGNAAGDTVTVTGTPTFAEDATFTKAIIANGNVTLGNAAGDTVTVTGTPTFAETATFNGVITANANVTLGNASSDVTTVTSQLTASAGATISGSFGLTADGSDMTVGLLVADGELWAREGMSVHGASGLFVMEGIEVETGGLTVTAGGVAVDGGGITVADTGITVDAGGIDVTGNSTFEDNVTINGDLDVNGTVTYIDSTNTTLKDTVMALGYDSDLTQTGAGDRGFLFGIDSENDPMFVWDDSGNGGSGEFVVGRTTSAPTDTTITISSYEKLHCNALDADAASTIASLTVEDLTNGVGGVVFSDTNGLLQDASTLIYATHLDLKADNAHLRVGAGNDLRFYHDAINSYIVNDTGILKVDASAGSLELTGTLSIADATTIEDNLTVKGTLSGSGAVTFGANLTANGVMAVAGAAVDTTYGIKLPELGSGNTGLAFAWATYSSEVYKENIETIKNPIDTVMKLRGVTYDWKVNGRKDIGLIAEEVEQVIPEVVHPNNEGKTQSLDYARLTSVLVEAIKAQQKEIDVLKALVS